MSDRLKNSTLTGSLVSSTYRNHLKFGYGPAFKTERENSFFNVQPGLANTPASFKVECLRAARLIGDEAKKQNKKVVVALSGGLDSEVIARSFLEADISIEVAILQYLPDLNDHDIQHATHFCRMNNIKTNYVDLDVFKYYETSDHRDSYLKYGCNSPMFSVHLELCRKFENDFLIFSGVVPLLHQPAAVHNHAHSLSRFNIINETISQFSLVEFPVENTFCFDRYFHLNSTSGVSNFFFYTPELILSALALGDVVEQINSIEDLSRKILSTPFDDIEYYHTQKLRGRLKYDIFRKAGFTVLPRESKFTGFEKIHSLCNTADSAEKESASLSGNNFQLKGLIRFNELYRAPMEKYLPPIKLGIFKIEENNLLWLREYALKNWVQKKQY